MSEERVWQHVPTCTEVHLYGAEGWRPRADGSHEHLLDVKEVELSSDERSLLNLFARAMGWKKGNR